MKTLQTQTKAIVGTMLALALIVAPATGFAKENNSNKPDKQEKQEKNHQEDGCLRAFGHLIAPGWIKVNGTVSISDNCRIPFGILKKLTGQNGTSTPDTIAPVISNLNVVVTGTSTANVRWNTNEKTIGAVFFGTTTPVVVQTSATSTDNRLLVGATSTNSTRIFDRDFSKSHKVRLNNLTASTTYYVVAVSRDKAGNLTISNATSFNTSTTTADVTPPVISNIVTVVGTSTIKVNWNTNELATSKLFYGTSTVNSTSSLNVSSSSLSTNHSLTASGLATGTVYHLLPQSRDASGNATTSAEYSVITSI
ncbi:MAG: hypothetical protein V4664_03695 [Patescibacteria group bacterium]